ncbi:MAG: cysteine desulfurase [Bacteroidetes bacterium]|nr:cysteine desulfurase [Bacteroidota bacterium]MCH8523767.1 cysteine desulfurase [Balneolales bacterium]
MSTTRHVYIDNAATTRLDERVLESMIPYLREDYANANSPHRPGRKTHVAVEEARELVASVIGAEPAEIIFTSGGTESNNSVINGVLSAREKRHLITSNAEHHAVLHPVKSAANWGAVHTILPVNTQGRVTTDQVADAITNETVLVSLMHGNNEVATLNPLKEIGEICRNKNILFHSDTVQTVGKIPVDVDDLGVDFLSISAHKLYGPKGVGALYARSGASWKPWMEGGSQERKRRGGTLNVAGIVGMAKALQLATEEMQQNQAHISALKARLMQGLKDRLGEHVQFNGDQQEGLYNILNCSFIYPDHPAIDGEMLLLNLDIEGIYCSNGSACTSGAIEASHVLLAMDIPYAVAKSSIRFSLSKYNTVDDITYIIDKTEAILRRMTTRT